MVENVGNKYRGRLFESSGSYGAINVVTATYPEIGEATDAVDKLWCTRHGPPLARITSTPTPMPTPIPTSTPVPTPVPTPTPTPKPTPTPIPTPLPTSPERILEPATAYMLELINDAREQAGVAPVTLGTNQAAQDHAEDMGDTCFSGHWGSDGLKSHMRYSFAGGYHRSGENVSGLDACLEGRYTRITDMSDMRQEIRKTVIGFLNSPGHRRTMLNAHYAVVNIGLAWDDYTLWAVQQFETAFLAHMDVPTLKDGHLTVAGSTTALVDFKEDQDLGVQVYYDPTPHALTVGQLVRTYCVDLGPKIAAFRPPLEPGWSYRGDPFFDDVYQPCPDPYDVPPSDRIITDADRAHQTHREAQIAAEHEIHKVSFVRWVTADGWEVDGTSFEVRGDISRDLEEHGAGVYTVLVWGMVYGEDVPIGSYAIVYDGSRR